MSRIRSISSIATLGAAVVLSAAMFGLAPGQDATSVRPQRQKKQDQPAAQVQPRQEMSPEEAAMMQAWMEYMTPGPAHADLVKRAGTWDLVVRMYAGPGAPAQESTAVSVIEPIMDGRYLLEKAEGSFQGMPFRGMGIIGYDNMLEKYVSVWVDNMGTGIMRMYGESTDGGKTISYEGEHPDFVAGKYKMSTSVDKMIDANTYHMKSWEIAPDGSSFVNFELEYRRRGAKPVTSAASGR